MSTWTDRIKSHAVWQHLDALGPAIDEALKREGIGVTAVASLERLRAVLAFIGRRMAASDSQLIHVPALDAIATNFQSAVTEVRNFIANGNEGHLANANNNADAVLKHASQIYSVPAEIDLADLSKLADDYRDTLESNLRAVQGPLASAQSELSSLKDKVSAFSNEIAAEKARLSQLAADYQSQFSTAQENRNKEFLDGQTTRQNQFASALSEHSQKLAEQAAESSKQRDQLLQSQNSALESLTADYRSKAEAVLKEINDHLEQVEKLVGVIGNLGVTSGYQKAANEARNTARVWQFVAVASLISIIVMAFKAFLPLVQGEFTWAGFAARVFVTLTVGFLAAYAISQADKYQQVERRSRKLALELEAIGPFLASLDPVKQDEFRIRIGDRSFGTSDDLIDVRSIDSPKSMLDLAANKDLRAFVTEIIKAVRSSGG